MNQVEVRISGLEDEVKYINQIIKIYDFLKTIGMEPKESVMY